MFENKGQKAHKAIKNMAEKVISQINKRPTQMTEVYLYDLSEYYISTKM